MSFNQSLVKAGQSTVVPLLNVLTGVTTGGPTLAMAAAGVAIDSLCANVSAAVTTNNLTIVTKWQSSQDGTNWVDMFGFNSPANVQVAATGNGGLVTTKYTHACPTNPPYPYMRLAIVSAAATGAAGDNITISYNYRKEQY